jgi:FAD/FMN-containing dehydrogenase
MTKLAYLDQQMKPPAMRVTKALKAAFDPQNILNPGKIVA